MSEDAIDYPRMLREALRQVPRQALVQVASSGLPEPHVFYLTFLTAHPGVVLAPTLRQQYPEEMTIVLKQQFRDLEVDDEGFSVTLYFGGRPQRLGVPFDALIAFVDPGAEFGLRFDGAAAEEEVEEEAPAPTGEVPEEGEAGARAPASVVSIDSFRRKGP
jgi:hypothetical protein